MSTLCGCEGWLPCVPLPRSAPCQGAWELLLAFSPGGLGGGREVPATRLQPPRAPAAVCSPHCREEERAALPSYSLMPSGKGFPQLEKEAVHTDPGSSQAVRGLLLSSWDLLEWHRREGGLVPDWVGSQPYFHYVLSLSS